MAKNFCEVSGYDSASSEEAGVGRLVSASTGRGEDKDGGGQSDAHP
jgi:hypothetical protein